MCGIVGMLSLGEAGVDPRVLQEMNDRLAHRGPDGEGFVFAVDDPATPEAFVSRAATWASSAPVRFGLGHRRLAILDLSDRGLQPMPSPDGRRWVAFNGEIYNYRELRDTLCARGHRFHTGTDTEVLLHAYVEWGDRCVDRLQGMFAFAIWDGDRQRLFCARDRLGIKPLYYTIADGTLLLASEIKALFASPHCRPEPDDTAVFEFLVHANGDYGERTMFRGVKALPAAHTLSADATSGSITVQRYWTLEPRPDQERSDEAQVDGLADLLLTTTQQHLISDVRAGSCLSGGLDSSTLVSLIGKIRRERPEDAASVGDELRTFTASWDYTELDERGYATAVADAAGAREQLVFPSADEFWNEFEHLAWHVDMPFASTAYYAQWSVMRAARDAGVKVLLDGQGGDEVFGGYAKFRYAYLASLLSSGRLTRFGAEMAATLKQHDRYVLDIRNGYRYLPAWVRRALRLDSLLSRILRVDWNRAVHDESTPATRWWRYAFHEDPRSPWSMLQRVQVDDLFVDTLPLLLRIEDRLSMALSIEARVPLLDHPVVEYGVSLPDHLKVHDGWSKFAVREAMRGLMPEAVRLRKSKLGFAAPDRFWLATTLRPRVTTLINGDLRAARYIDPAVLRRWYADTEHTTVTTESYLGLFRVLSLEMWMRAFDM